MKILTTALLPLILMSSCSKSTEKLSRELVPLSGELSREEILSSVDDGSLIGIGVEDLHRLCGEPENTGKFPEYDYHLVIGVCDSYAPEYQWLLVRIIDAQVVSVDLDCD